MTHEGILDERPEIVIRVGYDVVASSENDSSRGKKHMTAVKCQACRPCSER
jgi:hypothetical protein